MKFNSIVNNFSSGVWSEKMISRADTEEYFKACREILNMIPQLQGGLYRRPGTKFINLDTKQGRLEQGLRTRLIPWRVSTGQKYIIVANEGAPNALGSYWFIYNTASGAMTDITSTSSADFSDSDILTCQVAQVGDVIYMVSPSMPPRYFSFVGGVPYISAYHEYSGPYSTLTPWITVPYKPISADGIDGTITVTGTFTVGGSVTVASSVARFSSFMLPAYGAGRGLFIKVTSAGSTGVIEMTGYTSDTSITGVVRSAVAGASPVTYGSAANTSFEIAAWNGRDGFPRTIAPYEQRLYFGGSLSYPDTIWGSRIGTQLDMMEIPFVQAATFASFTSDNARPWSAALAVAPEAYQIQSMIAAKTLEIHTLKADIVGYGGNGNALGPLNKVFESSTSFGSEYVQPIRTNNYSSYVQRGGRKIRDVVYSFNEDQYKSGDLMFMADHYTFNDPIKRLASAELISTSIMFAITTGGKLYGCAIDRDYKMNAWHEWRLAGTDVKIVDVCVVPTAGTNNGDGIYFMVEREVNGSTEFSIEALTDIFEGDEYNFYGLGWPFYYMDSWQYFNSGGPATTTITGLSRLEGEMVSLIGDGNYLGEVEVTAGIATSPKACSDFIVGLNYRSYFKLMPMQAGAQFGTPVNQFKALRRVIINFYKTLVASYRSVSTDEYWNIPFREPSVPGDQQTPVFTGSKERDLGGYTGREVAIEMETSDPYPMNITSLVIEGVTYD